MTQTGIERRRSLRVDRCPPPDLGAGDAPSQPVLVNASAGGVCLWSRNPPAMDRPGKLRWRWEGQEQVLPARPVWLHTHLAACGSENVYVQNGWLAGFAFVSAQLATRSNVAPWNLPPSAQMAVDFLQEHDSFVPAGGELDDTKGPSLDLGTIDRLKAAAESLIPVLSRHFANAHLVVTRARVEISANFRPLAELNDRREPGQRRGAIQPGLAGPLPVSTQSNQEAPTGQLAGARFPPSYRLHLLAVASLLAVVIGWNALPVLLRRDRPSTPAKVPAKPRAIPAWAADLTPISRDGWMDIQAQFALTSAMMRSAIQILKVDDKYPPGHWLRDMTAYPIQIGRAFEILAGSGAGAAPDLRTLTKDLAMKLVSGSRFPDEPPGDRHFALSREMRDNTTVLAIIDLFRRRQADPGTKDLLAALQRGAGRSHSRPPVGQ